MKSNFLVDKKSFYSKSFFCYIKANGEVIVPDEEETYNPDEKDEKFEVQFKFRALNHVETTNIYSQSIALEGESVRVDVAVFNDLRLRATIREQNLTDDEGEILPINNRSVDNLNPIITTNMINIINETLGLGMGA